MVNAGFWSDRLALFSAAPILSPQDRLKQYPDKGRIEQV
jgi:hypothetical protein